MFWLKGCCVAEFFCEIVAFVEKSNVVSMQRGTKSKHFSELRLILAENVKIVSCRIEKK